jgi:hypothetical protein
VAALRNLYRKPSHRKTSHRKPSKITLAVAAVTTAASVAVASGVAFAASGTPAGQAMSVLPAARTATSLPANAVDYGRQLEAQRVYLASLGVRNLARAEQQAAAAARRAAARRAARRAAARLAAQQRAQQAQPAQQAGQASQQAGGTANAAVAPAGSPQQIAKGMLGSFGWSSSEFGCLQSLWNAESGWNVYASNPSSGAYGIPQALPGSKMASAGLDWQTNAATQIRWGLGYIKQLYGSPCGAWSHEQSSGWY